MNEAPMVNADYIMAVLKIYENIYLNSVIINQASLVGYPLMRHCNYERSIIIVYKIRLSFIPFAFMQNDEHNFPRISIQLYA
jgi:hypothetical protein